MDLIVDLKQGEMCSPPFWSLFIEDWALLAESRPGSGLKITVK